MIRPSLDHLSPNYLICNFNLLYYLGFWLAVLCKVVRPECRCLEKIGGGAPFMNFTPNFGVDMWLRLVLGYNVYNTGSVCITKLRFNQYNHTNTISVGKLCKLKSGKLLTGSKVEMTPKIKLGTLFFWVGGWWRVCPNVDYTILSPLSTIYTINLRKSTST